MPNNTQTKTAASEMNSANPFAVAPDLSAAGRGVHGGIGHDASVRGGRSDRGDGDRAAAVSGRAPNAGAFFSDAVPFHGVEHVGGARQRFDLPRLFQHRLSLFSRARYRFSADS